MVRIEQMPCHNLKWLIFSGLRFLYGKFTLKRPISDSADFRLRTIIALLTLALGGYTLVEFYSEGV